MTCSIAARADALPARMGRVRKRQAKAAKPKTLKAQANDLAAALIKKQAAAGIPQGPTVPAEMFDPETGWLLNDSRPARPPSPVAEVRRWYSWPRRSRY